MPGRRPRKTDPNARLVVHIPQSLVDALEAECTDPVTGKIPYSARAEVITRLLRMHFRGQDGERYHRTVGYALHASDRESLGHAMAILRQTHDEVRSQTEAFDRQDKDLDLSNLMG